MLFLWYEIRSHKVAACFEKQLFGIYDVQDVDLDDPKCTLSYCSIPLASSFVHTSYLAAEGYLTRPGRHQSNRVHDSVELGFEISTLLLWGDSFASVTVHTV